MEGGVFRVSFLPERIPTVPVEFQWERLSSFLPSRKLYPSTTTRLKMNSNLLGRPDWTRNHGDTKTSRSKKPASKRPTGWLMHIQWVQLREHIWKNLVQRTVMDCRWHEFHGAKSTPIRPWKTPGSWFQRMKETETQQLQEFKEGIANGSDTPVEWTWQVSVFCPSLKQASIPWSWNNKLHYTLGESYCYNILIHRISFRQNSSMSRQLNQLFSYAPMVQWSNGPPSTNNQQPAGNIARSEDEGIRF